MGAKRMMSFETERLTMTIIGREDVGDVFETMNSRAAAEAVSFLHWPVTVDQAENWCRRSVDGVKSGREYLYLARESSEAVPAGCVGIHRTEEEGMAEMGYWVAEIARGKGYGTEMALAAIDIATNRLGVRKLAATTAIDNRASQKILEKCGFRFSRITLVRQADGTERPSNLYVRELNDEPSRRDLSTEARRRKQRDR